MTTLVFANSVNSNAISTHRDPNLLRSSSNQDSDSKMNNSVEVVFQDLDAKEEYTLQLSPNTALRAHNEASQAASNDGMLEYAQDALDEDEEMNENSAAANKENFRWSEPAIMLLLEEYRLREPSMSSGKTSHVKAWKEIAAVMKLKGHNVSGRQCMTRLNTMKRTYKAIKDHNGKSGNNRRTWKYYDAMESLIGQKPFMAPLATISSTAPQNDVESSSSSVASATNQVTRKRKASDAVDKLLEAREAAEEGKERRHKERMEMQTKMIHFLSQLVRKE
ncbi:uncharacterized protein LOC124294794 [Neodiprion lecontei]|uniref:Uncharacterized protein LOC124294794 n=1 Tax=Neodiprion lecontei TaxID=441921 RepID=A0ABM3GCD7_NEOLC|nr:uncharacterized protein LOC124294794 [Neodiprion lecontei]